MSSHDAQGVADLFTDDGTFNDRSTGQVYRGKEEIRSMVEGWLRVFPDFKLKADRIIGSGDTFTIQLTCSGTQEGELDGIPASGNEVTFPSCDVFQLKGEKIQSVDCYYAAPVMLLQMGVSIFGQGPLTSSQEEGRQALS